MTARPPVGSVLWHRTIRQWVEVIGPHPAPGTAEVRVKLRALPDTELVVKVASLSETQ